MTNSLLVFLESNTTGTGRLFVRAARAEGCTPVLLTKNPTLYPFADEEGVQVIEVDTTNEEILADLCSNFARTDHLAGITSTSDYYLLTVANLAARLGLPGPSADAIARCRDKELQYNHLRSSGVPVPIFWAARSCSEALSVAMDIGFPVVVKPVGGSGSVGVRLCKSGEEVTRHAQRLLNQTTNERGMAIRPAILVQEFIEGPEFSIESLGGKIVGITEKHLSAQPVFVEMGHDFPAEWPCDEACAIKEAVRHALKALDLEWGAAHTELRLWSGKPTIIEVNPRLAGGFIPELVRRSTGIDLIRGLTRRILGRDPMIIQELEGYASIRFIVPQRSGTLREVIGLETARAVEGVYDITVYREPGYQIRLAGDFHDRIGHIMTSCSDPAATRRSAERALALLSVSIT